MQASKSFYDNKEDFLQLWVHESMRVMGDRMWDPVDLAWLRKQLDDRLSTTFGISFASLFEDFQEQVSHRASAACYVDFATYLVEAKHSGLWELFGDCCTRTACTRTVCHYSGTSLCQLFKAQHGVPSI